MRVVLDTNVIVSAFLSPFGTPARVVRLISRGIVPVFDVRILVEYQDVLARPRFGFSPDAVAVLLQELRTSGELVIAHPLDIDLPDPDDVAFLEVAVTARADALVTGNAKHFILIRGHHDVKVISPAEMIAALT
jgi:putative PIN family toxin of toxin-antitoxin system